MWTIVRAVLNCVIKMLLNVIAFVDGVRVRLKDAPLAVPTQEPVEVGVAVYCMVHAAFCCPKLNGTVVDLTVLGAGGTGCGTTGAGPV
jgi:hypothetical protein